MPRGSMERRGPTAGKRAAGARGRVGAARGAGSTAGGRRTRGRTASRRARGGLRMTRGGRQDRVGREGKGGRAGKRDRGLRVSGLRGRRPVLPTLTTPTPRPRTWASPLCLSRRPGIPLSNRPLASAPPRSSSAPRRGTRRWQPSRYGARVFSISLHLHPSSLSLSLSICPHALFHFLTAPLRPPGRLCLRPPARLGRQVLHRQGTSPPSVQPPPCLSS